MATPKVSVPTEKAIDVTTYKNGGGSSFSGDSGTFYMQKPGMGTYVLRTQMQMRSYWFIWVGTCDEVTPVTPANPATVSIALYDSSQNEVPIVSVYNAAQEGWEVEVVGALDANGYWIEYTVSGTIYQYPQLDDPVDWWNESNLTHPLWYHCCTSEGFTQSLWQSNYATWTGDTWTIADGLLRLQPKSGSSWASGFRPTHVRVTYSSSKPAYGAGASWYDEVFITDSAFAEVGFVQAVEGSVSGTEIELSFGSDDLLYLSVYIYWSTGDRLPASQTTISEIEFKVDGVWKSYLYEEPK